MEAEDEDFAMEGVELEESRRDAFAVFVSGKVVEGGGTIRSDLKVHGAVVFAGAVYQLIEAGHGALATLVNDEVAGDGEEPCFKAGLTVELSTADEDAHPDFLEEILGHFAVSGEVKEIADEAVLVADDELIEEAGIVALESLGDSKTLLPHLFTGGCGFQIGVVLDRDCCHG